MQPVLVTTTTNTIDEAEKIAAKLVADKLAACVNILGPIKSIYIWEGATVNDTEYKLFIKTFENYWGRIRNLIKEIHSYTVPEISMIKISDMHPNYLSWMHEVL
ncbi:MAG: divalent-cation tolerance protein CutA [Spirochaetia bacterium]|nr:divalent-cation tolerance protein CutA [Spirochaetia bacterium]